MGGTLAGLVGPGMQGGRLWRGRAPQSAMGAALHGKSPKSMPEGALALP